MKKQPKVSVIMPIYNVEKYLEESLESVLNQTLKDIEIVCVDDGSTDCSGEILDRYAFEDKRIVVIHKQNTGYGHSMNVGIERALGEYIAIVEPDDFIKKEMLEDLYILAEKYDVDFIKSDYMNLYGEKGNYQTIQQKVVKNGELYNQVLDKQKIICLFDGAIAHWTGLYKKSFLQKYNIVFHESPGASYQDNGFWFQTLFFAERVYLVNNSYYCYRRDNLNSSIHSKEKVYCISKEYDFIFERLKEQPEFIKKYLPVYVEYRYFGYLETFKRISDEYKKEFLVYISGELKILQQNGLLDLSLLNETDRKRIFMIQQNPEDFYKRWKNKETDLNALCSGNHSLYIYGAGHFAEKAYGFLSEDNRKRVCGFVVTDKKENKENLFGYPIYSYSELIQNEDRQVLIGVSELYVKEIKDMLLEKKEKNIIELPYEVM